MHITSVGDYYFEVELLPKSDLPAMVAIARACGGTNLQRVCKVCVTFVRDPLTYEVCNDKPKYPGAEPDEQLDTFRCSDVDHT